MSGRARAGVCEAGRAGQALHQGLTWPQVSSEKESPPETVAVKVKQGGNGGRNNGCQVCELCPVVTGRGKLLCEVLGPQGSGGCASLGTKAGDTGLCGAQKGVSSRFYSLPFYLYGDSFV